MARKCTICGRGPTSAVSRSHSNVATKRRQYINLQTKKISGKRVKLCTRCLKTLKKNSKI
ncbi:50S ribosomal protein L28 [Patescibacteria group bacterium AH-259-L05]|nr:50S ribosomal protein L28 [Patescibacteria group bacterium AH-259-L05]